MEMFLWKTHPFLFYLSLLYTKTTYNSFFMQENIVRLLLSHGALQVSFNKPFVWSSGITSPIYCDNRKLFSDVAARKEIVRCLIALIQKEQLLCTAIGGTATAGIPWASFLAHDLEKPLCYIRPKKKRYGRGRQVEGDLKQGATVLVVEDVVSTGGSALAASIALRHIGCVVTHVVSIVSWGFLDTQKRVAQESVSFLSLVQAPAIIHVLKEDQHISSEEGQILLRFFRQPSSWASEVLV